MTDRSQCVCGTKVPLRACIDGSTECRVCGIVFKAKWRSEPDPCACSGGKPSVVERDGLECGRCGVAMVGNGELRDTIVRWNRMQFALCHGSYATLLLLADIDARPEVE